jgi:hypothetical protein
MGSNLFENICVFLILARRGLYGGMRMAFAGREEWEWQNMNGCFLILVRRGWYGGMGMSFARRENGNDRT